MSTSINQQRVKGTTHTRNESDRRWHRYWRREYPTSDHAVADAVAQIDRLEREAKGPLSISFKEARAVGAMHGVRCECHYPDPIAS